MQSPSIQGSSELIPVRHGHVRLSWPLFTCFHATIQIFMVVWVCYKGGITSQHGLTPILRTRLEPLTLQGDTFINHTIYPNPWYGPSQIDLVKLGALFAPCVRTDHRYNFQYAMLRRQQLLSGRPPLGCCELPSLNVAGTTTKGECQSTSASIATEWKTTECVQRRPGQNTVAHVIRPCCVGLSGTCLMTSPHHCWFLSGLFHLHAEHCSQVDCLSAVCALTTSQTVDVHSKSARLPPSHYQWWRFLTSIYIPHGFIDGLLVAIIGFPYNWLLERKIGWLRIMLVHTTAGVGGHMVGSLFSIRISVISGGAPSVAGVIVVGFICHLLAWELLTKPFVYPFCSICTMVSLLFLGTFPFMNNYSNFSGLILGILLAFVYLPFLQINRKREIRVVSFLFIFLTFLICLFFFYEVQPVCIGCLQALAGWTQ